jgi:hypothetical protein
MQLRIALHGLPEWCCQLAEMSATKHTKVAANNNLIGRKNSPPNCLHIFQKMAKKWPNIFEVFLSHKGHNYLQK